MVDYAKIRGDKSDRSDKEPKKGKKKHPSKEDRIQSLLSMTKNREGSVMKQKNMQLNLSTGRAHDADIFRVCSQLISSFPWVNLK